MRLTFQPPESQFSFGSFVCRLKAVGGCRVEGQQQERDREEEEGRRRPCRPNTVKYNFSRGIQIRGWKRRRTTRQQEAAGGTGKEHHKNRLARKKEIADAGGRHTATRKIFGSVRIRPDSNPAEDASVCLLFWVKMKILWVTVVGGCTSTHDTDTQAEVKRMAADAWCQQSRAEA